MSPVITAQHPSRGTLYAAIEPTARFVRPEVRDSRFGARLAPFASINDAKAALTAAGCEPAN